MKNKTSILTAAFAIALSSLSAQSTSPFKVINTFHIASTAGWDYIEVGPVNDWLYVSHAT